jgi:hypothetical protein
MSDIIRGLSGSWTPPPRARSFDPRVIAPPDTYRFTQNEIESAQRTNQNAMNRTLRAGNLASAPLAARDRIIPIAPSPNVIITLPIP